jgi:CubicO group peptidase (beta-lactamase class C family)
MSSKLHALALVAALACFGSLTAAAYAEEQTPPPVLPFDPLAVELVLPGSTIARDAGNVRSLPSDPKPVGAVTYSWAGQTKTISQLLLESGTDAFVAVDAGKIASEVYFDLNAPWTRHQSWSVMKSFTSSLIGIAIAEGHIDSVDDPVTKYVPALAANGYNGVSIRDVLQMSSGIAWNESYLDPVNADVAWLVGDPVLDNLSWGVAGRTLDEFATSSEWTQVVAPGTQWHYNSLNTQVLGMVLARATGQPVRRYLEQKIWKPAGMATSGWLLRDRPGTDFTFCCLYATARDYARFGLVYENGGVRGSSQVVPAGWVYDSTHSTATHLQPGAVAPNFGYGYQWWLGDGTRGDFLALGLEGQWIYVSPADDTVIVKLSDDLTLTGNRSAEILKAFRAVADYLRTH